MSNIQLHLLDAGGGLTMSEKKIREAFKDACAIAEDRLGATNIDVVVRDEPNFAIPELGIGGFTDASGQIIYISVDSKKKLLQKNILMTFIHEFHHAVRFQKIGWSKSFSEHVVVEGLACLFEKEITGQIPIYAKVKITQQQITKANMFIKKSDSLDDQEWFFGGGIVPRWFGYTYGYQLVRDYSLKSNKSAVELVFVNSQKVTSA